jgi:hypothetical protein
MICSIIFFFLLLLFVGFSLLYVSKIHLSYDWFVRIIIYLGTGLGGLVLLIILFDVIGIPLDWKIFAIISLICPAYYFIVEGRRKSSAVSFAVSQNYIYYALVCTATILLFATYYQGAHAYQYLEDDDPWSHAVAVKYVAEQKTYAQEPEQISHYLEPYPPTFDAILGLMYQINGSVFLTLKMFNILLIALGILFFFVFVMELFNIRIATAAAIILVALPGFMSHFIWSHTLGLVLFFPAFFTAYKAFSDKQWMFPAVILIAAEMIAHPFVSVLFGIFFILFLLVFLFQQEYQSFKNGFTIGLCGVLLSVLYWGQQLIKHGLHAVLYSHTGGFGGVASTGIETAADMYINPAYTLWDLLIAPIVTKIDQPIGFGVLAFLLAMCGFIYLIVKYKEKNHAVIASWFIFTFIGLMGGHLPFSILTHRFWAYVSIPLAISAGIFVVFILEKLWNRKVIFTASCIILAIGIFGIPFFEEFNVYTSWYPKYVVETAQWPPGTDWSSIPELEAYMWMHDTLKNKKVFSLCKEERYLIGFDIETEFPNPETDAFRKNLANTSVQDIGAFTSSYDYLSLEYSCVKKAYLTEEQLNARANQLAQQYTVVFMNDEVVIYKIR